MRRALLLLVGIYVVIGVVGWLAGLVVAPPNNARGPLQGIDDGVRNTILSHNTPSMIRVADFLVKFGKIELLIPLVAVITILLLRGGLRARAFAPALSLAGTGLLVEPLKHAIARTQPSPADLVHNLAWPSGHTAGITAVVVPLAALAWVMRRWWWPSVVAAGFVVAVGAAMLVVDAHWLTDVIGGALLAAAWGVAVVVLLPDRIGAPTELQAPRRTDAATGGQPPQPPQPPSWNRPEQQPPAWRRPAEWMS